VGEWPFQVKGELMFKVGERVSYEDDPEDLGTVMFTEQDDKGQILFAIFWDKDPEPVPLDRINYVRREMGVAEIEDHSELDPEPQSDLYYEHQLRKI
jgi:hypothetical protein